MQRPADGEHGLYEKVGSNLLASTLDPLRRLHTIDLPGYLNNPKFVSISHSTGSPIFWHRRRAVLILAFRAPTPILKSVIPAASGKLLNVFQIELALKI